MTTSSPRFLKTVAIYLGALGLGGNSHRSNRGAEKAEYPVYLRRRVAGHSDRLRRRPKCQDAQPGSPCQTRVDFLQRGLGLPGLHPVPRRPDDRTIPNFHRDVPQRPLSSLRGIVHGRDFQRSAGQGWRLQQQTNALSVGLSTNWVEVTDSSVSSTNIRVDRAQPAVFYRLAFP
jgi:hypothetical protein